MDYKVSIRVLQMKRGGLKKRNNIAYEETWLQRKQCCNDQYKLLSTKLQKITNYKNPSNKRKFNLSLQ
jgi:hypothetical protein